MSLHTKIIVAVAVVIAGGGLVGTGWAIYYFGYAIDHHPDASRLQHELEALPGVVRVDVQYSADWLAFEGDVDGGGGDSLSVSVVLRADASAAVLLDAALATQAIVERHKGWESSLKLATGGSGIGIVGLPTQADVVTAVDLFVRLRTLGAVHGTVSTEEGRPTLRVAVELPDGSTASDLRPAYAALDGIRRSTTAISLLVDRLTAADGSGFSTDGGSPTRAEWAEQGRLSAISVPGADLGVYLWRVGAATLVFTPRESTAQLDNPEFRRRLTTAVRQAILEYRDRNGGYPDLEIRIGRRLVAEVNSSRCHRGLTSWDDELNRWYWAVDCSRWGGDPPHDPATSDNP